MRTTMPLASLLSVFATAGTAMAAGPAPAGQVLRLECQGPPAVAPLCDALRDELLRRGHRLEDQAPLRLTLRAEAPAPSVVTARLDLEQDGQHREGAPGTLSVIDRQTLPAIQLQGFAAALLNRAGL